MQRKITSYRFGLSGASPVDSSRSSKLKSMIERAGYPSIASELDENLIQAVMPKIEKRAWDLVSMNNK